MLHFSWDISLGNVLTAVALIGVALKYHRVWVGMHKEHRMMWIDFCQRHHIKNDPDFADE